MGVSFVARKCTQCAGRLQYIKEKKLWKCLYCGAEIERQEQYDGLFTIKNVVRQCLLDTAFRRLDSAAKNLVECEKIDSRYVGTLIAKRAIAKNINTVVFDRSGYQYHGVVKALAEAAREAGLKY